jgi:methylamine dehydrogenase accessory protein MauD
MMTGLLVSVIVLWLVVLGMAAVIMALARQVGILHERLAPVGALTIGADPVVGKAAPRVKAASLAGTSVEVGAPLPSASAQLLLFVAADCPVCKKIIPMAQAFARRERLELLLVGDGDLGEQRQLAQAFAINPERFVTGAQIGMAFRVGKVPYAVLLDPASMIAAMGLVNSREHLESLVVAHETGFASIQSYLSANKITSLGG